MPKKNKEDVSFGKARVSGGIVPSLVSHHRAAPVFGSADSALRADGEIKIPKKVNNAADVPACFSSHMGVYLVEPRIGAQMANLILSGKYKSEKHEDENKPDDDEEEELLHVSDGVALIHIAGMMQKGFSKFGGTSTRHVRRQLAAALADDSVKGIFLNVDSPGGNVNGTRSLADDIAAAGKIKPVHAHVEDTGASAALWVASQANTVSVNRGGSVGSIGVYMVIHDTSENYKREGVKVHVISTGKNKGTGVAGTKITNEDLKGFQDEVDALNAQFVGDVANGRGMALGDVMRLATGKMFNAKRAMKDGLVDSIMSDTEAFAKMAAGELGKNKSGKVVDNRQSVTDNLTVQDTGDETLEEETDTPQEAKMDPEQILVFLKTDEDGKALLASLVADGVKAELESGGLVSKADVDTAVKAAVEGVTAKAADATALDEQARDVFAIDETVPLATVREKLAAVYGEVRAERFERLKAEASVLAGKNAKAPKDKTAARSNEEKFEAYWAKQKDPTDATAKASARKHFMSQI